MNVTQKKRLFTTKDTKHTKVFVGCAPRTVCNPRCTATEIRPRFGERRKYSKTIWTQILLTFVPFCPLLKLEVEKDFSLRSK